MMQYWKKTMTSLQPTCEERQLSPRLAALGFPPGEVGCARGQQPGQAGSLWGSRPPPLAFQYEKTRLIELSRVEIHRPAGLVKMAKGLLQQQERHSNSGTGCQVSNGQISPNSQKQMRAFFR